MPTISMFYGLVIRMLFMDTKQHNLPHLHVEYQGREAVVTIPGGELLEGELPANKMRLLLAWIEIYQEELMADWSLAVRGEPVFRIQPLR